MEATQAQQPQRPQFRHSHVGVGASSVHVVESGHPDAMPVVFLHGWPESWRAWRPVMELAAPTVRAVALDLPGVGGSAGVVTDGSKRQIADVVHEVVEAMEMRDVTIVGHDAGGMVAYAYARAHDPARVVIADVVVPGLDPWEAVLANPYLWHFAFHAVPDLPERLVAGHVAEYFDYFYDVITARPERITAADRAAHTEAYATPAALTAGFGWYRAFPRDAAHNRETAGQPLPTPLLYLRGEHEGGDIAAYVAGFRAAGVVHVEHGVVSGAGHFTPEEAPQELWRLIADFITA